MVCSLSDAMGARGARACDYCIRKRARWYCAADDAFLCQTCDSSVHSANPLARRHGRVELKTTTTTTTTTLESIEPSWHPRKARTPRHGKPPTVVVSKNPVHLVPEICSQENSHDDNDEEQLLYRVPIFVPDLCNTNITDANAAVVVNCSSAGHTNWEGKIINNMATEMELAEFAADVESLLGKGLDDEESSFDMEGLGFLGADDINNQSEMECCFGYDEKVMKVEEENNAAEAAVSAQVLTMNHMTNFDTLDLKFDYDDSPANNEEEEMSTVDDGSKIIMRKKTILLNLDYEGVILAWSDHRSPWTTGQRPAELNSNHASWPDCMQRGCGTIHSYGVGMRSGIDGGREARVSRYREKRRSRLFSKKIRYEVRKLNAEKRPRMKGRFVKRPNFPSINK